MIFKYYEVTPEIIRPIIEVILKSETRVGILGQQGFFDHFDVKLSYQKQTIEIEPLKISN